MAGPNVLQETVVKLGTVVDNQGIDQILKFLTNSRFKALSLTAAFTGLTSAVYTFVKSSANNMRTLDELSKKQGKSLETVRASENALKAMGKTLNEVNKSVDLQKTYNDLVKINKELALPDTKRTLENINNLRASFWKMKDVANYAIDLIGAKVLAGLEAPIKRITENFEKIANWLKNNLNNVATKISSFVIAFSKGLIGIAETLTTIIGFVNNLNPGIRKLGTAILFVWGIIRSGPLGQLIAAVTLIGDMIHDFENFKWNQSKGITNELAAELYNNPEYFNGGYITEAGKNFVKSKVPGISDADLNNVVNVGVSNVWSKLFNENGELDFASAAKEAVAALTKALNDFLTGEGQINIADIFKFDSKEGEQGLIGKIANWITENQDDLSELGEAFIGAITRGVQAITSTGSAAFSGLWEALTGAPVPDSIKTGDNSIANSLVGGLILKFTGHDTATSILGALLTGISQYAGGKDLEKDFEEFGGQILTGLQNSFKNLHTFAAPVLDTLLGAIFGDMNEVTDSNGNTKKISEAVAYGPFGEAILNGIGIGIATGSTGWGIVGVIGTVIKDAVSDQQKMAQLKEDVKLLGGKVVDFLFGEETMVNGAKKRSGGILDTIGELFGGLWDELSPQLDEIYAGIIAWLEPLGEQIKSWFDSLWFSIVEGMPEVLRDQLGIGEKTKITDNGDGTLTYTSTDGSQITVGNEKDTDYGITVSDVLKFFGSTGVSNNPFGSSTTKTGTTFEIPGMRESPIKDVGKWNSYMAIFSNILTQTAANGDAPGLYYLLSDFNKLRGEVNQVKDSPAKVENLLNGRKKGLWLDYFNGEGTLPEGFSVDIPVTANTNDADSEIQSLISKWNSKTIKLKIAPENGATNLLEAYGGRFGSETNNVTVGEDGAEYIVPITKPERAAQLLKQLFGEMGSSFTDKFMKDFGIGKSSTIGGDMRSITSALSSGATINMNYNVSAPCTINVSASGVSAEQVGEQAYNSAQRHLLRTLKGVFA